MTYLDSLFNLKGKVVALTGGGGMLCGTMARAYAKAGCKVCVLDLRLEKAELAATEIKSSGGEATAYQLDATVKTDFEGVLTSILAKHSRIDVLVNGAGINAPTPLLEISEKEWDDILGSHLKGTLFGCQVFGKQMLEQGRGSIINISSASSGPPLSKAFAYSVAKAGIKSLTQNIAREWAKFGVRVNAIRPGFFPTEWSRKNFITPEREKAILTHTAMGRYGEADELVGCMLWLASDAASFVTGSEVAVDGGFSAMTI